MARIVILNADDLGYEPAVSEGIVRSMRDGVVSSATLIVNGPHSAHGAALAAGLSVGLHLNLVRFEAVLTGAALSEAALGEWTAAEVAAEVQAQLDRAHALMGRAPTHIDAHRHAHRHGAVLAGVAEVARRRGLPVRSLDEGMRAALRDAGVRTNDVFVGDAVSGGPAYWTPEAFARALGALPADGVVELMCHPGLAPRALSSGYGAQREVELATFSSSAARAALAAHGVTLQPWSAV